MTKQANINANRIKVFVSTNISQGYRKNDFCFVSENEPVRSGFVCDRDINNPDGVCGCGRSLIGFYCHKATTTVKVGLIDMTREQYIEEYIKSNPYASLYKKDKKYVKIVKEQASEFLDIADRYEVETVFEYRNFEFTVRGREYILENSSDTIFLIDKEYKAIS